MVLLIIMALAIIAGTIVLSVHCVKLVCASKGLMVVFGVVIAVALAVGIRFGVFGDFQLNDRMRMQGAPLPLVVFVLEGQNWTDFVKPPFVSYLCMVANAVFPVGLTGLLWMLLIKLMGRSLGIADEVGVPPVR